MDVFWPALLTGLVLLVGSVFVWRRRESIAKANATNMEAAFGKTASRSSTKSNMTYPAIGMMVVGAVAVAMSFLGADAF